MQTVFGILGVIVLLVFGFFILKDGPYNEKQDNMSTPVEIVPLEHATGVLRWAGSAIYFDPTGGAEAFVGQEPASIVLVTDIHGDHLSTTTLEAVVGEGTSLIVPQAVKDELPETLAARAKVLQNGQMITEQGFSITALPMYNLPGKENSNFHTKGRGNGYLIEREGYRFYIAGDTAGTPEMRALKNIDAALVPMNLPYTMSVDEAAEAVLAFAPTRVYPYHYRGQGGLADVGRFKELVNAKNLNIEVLLLQWYPQ